MNTILLLCLVLIAAVTLSYFLNKEGFTNRSRVNSEILDAQKEKKEADDKLKTATATAAATAEEYNNINTVVNYLNLTSNTLDDKMKKAIEELTKIKTSLNQKSTAAAAAATTATTRAATATTTATQATDASTAADADPISTPQFKKSKSDIKTAAVMAAGIAAAAASTAVTASRKASDDYNAVDTLVSLLSSTTSTKTKEQKIQEATTYLTNLKEIAKEKMNIAEQKKVVANLQEIQTTKTLDKLLNIKIEEDEMEKTKEEITNKKHIQTSSAANPSKTDIVPDTDISEIGQDAKALQQKSELIKDIQKVVRNEILANRNTTYITNNDPESCEEESETKNTASTFQGKEYNNSCNKPDKPDMSQYIKKNSIPCWGCSLDY
jgi:hypothetical protein